ncbi:energy-coupling factor ABC transporter ATP-binding protein [Pseudovibrio flavus]|uniref:energy-coupling factor ABC transporter ATP-binding protein n=1 Tax=Pseudovibrio flavus TaxID=2529854 RepID=UPI00211D0F66|nr:energy-coupling factor ABC transporter ATP-binding protein [Pseudovibrio flavus]
MNSSSSQSGLISCKGVSINRGNNRVISDLSALIAEKRVGIIGRNGSGKSTFIRSLNGLLPVTSGELQVHGLDAKADHSRLCEVTGFVFQNPDHQLIFPTALEEVTFGLRQKGADKKLAKAQAEGFLKDHGLGAFCDKPVHELSEGQKQYLCILAVLVMEPKLLVLDEPFSSLDFRTICQLQRKLEKLDQQIVFVSHLFNVLEDYDRVLWLEDGKLKGDGAPQDVLPAYLENEKRTSLEYSGVEF